MKLSNLPKDITFKKKVTATPSAIRRNILVNPKLDNYDHLDEKSRTLVLKTIEFFEARGKAKIKADEREYKWYADYLDFVKKEKLFSTFLTPAGYGDKDCRWDTYRNGALNEIFSFYGLSHWYSWQVTILGLLPIWISKNEVAKKRAAKLLEEGGIFAFGLSEKEHGADIYSSDMHLTRQEDGSYLANGSKYYIGNGNKAALVSTFGKLTNTDEYVFFVVESQHKNYELIKNVINSQNYVAEYKLNDYPIREEDILAKGRDACDMALNTINVGKFNLGWGSIGTSTHAFYEAINHASHRRLFDHYITDFVHIKQLFNESYARLTAMKLFTQRGVDYVRCASADDRRYLLFTPMVKMKVTTQGEEVVDLLWNVIAAKGVEKDMFFETALKEIRTLPKLEGTVHINMALILKFMGNYFFKPAKYPVIPTMSAQANDTFLFNQGPTKGLGKTRFHDYREVYNKVDLPNVNIFKKQIRLLKLLLLVAKPNKEQAKDFDFLLNLGELFTLVVYGHLILENAEIKGIEDDLVEQIFDFMVRDFSKFALQLSHKSCTTLVQQTICDRMIKRPTVDEERYTRVWENYTYKMKDQYEMNP